ncbi:Brain-enriched guanylate kinase-associated protein, partial [Galemys pyrenaicus]
QPGAPLSPRRPWQGWVQWAPGGRRGLPGAWARRSPPQSPTPCSRPPSMGAWLCPPSACLGAPGATDRNPQHIGSRGGLAAQAGPGTGEAPRGTRCHEALQTRGGPSLAGAAAAPQVPPAPPLPPEGVLRGGREAPLSGSVLFTRRLRSPWVPSCLGQPRVLQGRLAWSSPSLWDSPEGPSASGTARGAGECALTCPWARRTRCTPVAGLSVPTLSAVGRPAAACRCSALQEQKGELRKRLSYTTHKLEKLETEFDSTRHYLEIELRRAQEELEKVTEKLRRIQSNYMALQRINQELEDKLYRMVRLHPAPGSGRGGGLAAFPPAFVGAGSQGQHYEEEKRALSHEIVALNSHLLEAKVTIDKLSEDNVSARPLRPQGPHQPRQPQLESWHGESWTDRRPGPPGRTGAASPGRPAQGPADPCRQQTAPGRGPGELYRKDCNLAAQLLRCSQTYGRVHKVSELPSGLQERVSLHMEKHGRSLPSPLCHPAYADGVPPCVIAKVLEKPDPASLSSRLSDASARDLAFRDGVEKPGPRPPYKGDLYCSDTALYCPEERPRDRRPSVDAPVTDVGFLRAQNSDSTAEDEEEAGAAAFPTGFRHEAFPSYAGSLPTSSSYSSFSATSEEKEHAQASTLTASQQAIYLNSRDELFDRKPPAAAYPGSPRFTKATAAAAAPLEAEVAPGFAQTVSPYPAEPFRFPASPGPQPALMPPNLWSLRAKPGSARLPGEDRRGQWRPLSVEDIGAYSYPTTPAGRASPCSFSERYYGSGGSPSKKAEGRASPLYASYQADSFSEAEDLAPGHLAEPCFLRASGDLSLSPGRSADPRPGYAPSEGDGERLGVPLCGPAGSPEPEPSLHSSRDSLEPSSMEASPEMHPAARLSPQPAFPRTGGSGGLSRKDSLTKAQLYGTLLN